MQSDKHIHFYQLEGFPSQHIIMEHMELH